MSFPVNRLRRLRRPEPLRRMSRETRLSPDDLILPLFVVEGTGVREAIVSMPCASTSTRASRLSGRSCGSSTSTRNSPVTSGM